MVENFFLFISGIARIKAGFHLVDFTRAGRSRQQINPRFWLDNIVIKQSRPPKKFNSIELPTSHDTAETERCRCQ